ncbi:MAG: Omp28-related outer membrane protein [Chitinophagales bacterium]|nr:Omp28-related outer membrane protein [Chitinophagales bacterium]
MAGRVYEFEYTYTLNDDWNADNMHVVAFVHNAETDNKEVLQVAEVEVVE